jgi:hypothetical protein
MIQEKSKSSKEDFINQETINNLLEKLDNLIQRSEQKKSDENDEF